MKERIKLLKKYFKKSQGKEDLEINEIINNDLNNALNRAKILLVNEEISEPFILRGPNLYDSNLKYRLNRNNKDENFTVQYNNSLVTILFLGKNKLFYYQSEVNHINGMINSELTGEVKYDNILNTELVIDSELDKKHNPVTSIVNLVLTLENENELIFNLRNHYEFNKDNYLDVLTEEEKYIVKTIKQAINIDK